MALQGLDIRRSSASLRSGGTGLRKVATVGKYLGPRTCIGCKAWEAACQEWNDLPNAQTSGPQHGTYQTLPTMTANFWNLIKFREVETQDHGLQWLMRKDQCMHCDEPGCLEACPAPGAIVQYVNGIVDVDPEKCIGCGLCETGCPFDVPRYAQATNKMAKCTLCVDRVSVGLEPACIKACPTGCLQFGDKTALLEVAPRPRGRGDRRRDRPASSRLPGDPLGGRSVLLRRPVHRDADLVPRVRLDGLLLRRPLRLPLAARLARRGVRRRRRGDGRALAEGDGVRQVGPQVQRSRLPAVLRPGGPRRRQVQRGAEVLLLAGDGDGGPHPPLRDRALVADLLQPDASLHLHPAPRHLLHRVLRGDRRAHLPGDGGRAGDVPLDDPRDGDAGVGEAAPPALVPGSDR